MNSKRNCEQSQQHCHGWCEAFAALANKQNLSSEHVRELANDILSGQASTSQICALLMGLAAKGETADEVVGMANAMFEVARMLKVPPTTVDIVGVGGAKRRQEAALNVSTIASIVASSAGATVAKHGNRRNSSTSGSFDLLAALGVNIKVEPSVVEACVDQIGLGFAFAPTYHPAMRHVKEARSVLKIPTIFNMVGPLTNPARLRAQLLGVSDERRAKVMSEALVKMDMDTVWLVTGADQLDELTIWGQSKVREIKKDTITEFTLTPEQVGLTPWPADAVGGGDAAENAAITRSILAGEKSANRDMVILNAGAALCVAGVSEDISSGVQRCIEAVDSGAAADQLDKLVEITNR